ncbi:hypothetical protein DOTSEDRAFT_71505 [Dothistroma septosporum NZE10]|uniref:Uncharacterized protein n=1 Tax=Dothistroma septosporum (strain NZE10 / CBS 128990) TaxID=675120 RepID=N1PU00_DOTSN|nr:hypothetical protein DOTSEDRAFT_71505 [Dothistroma septosporum NZE10]
MSYYQGSQYQQQQQPPAREGHWDQYNRWVPTSNGGAQQHYGGEYAQPQDQLHQYPGQSSYTQPPGGGGGGGGGAAVQALSAGHSYQDTYQSPRGTTFGSPIQVQQYNPQNYSQPAYSQPPQQAAYNPAAYAPTGQGQSPYAAQYNPAAFADASHHNAAAAGPVDPYGYSPGNYSQSSFSPRQPQQVQSPHSQFSPTSQHSEYSPQPQSQAFSYPQSPPPPPPPAHNAYQTQGGAQYGQTSTAPYPTEPYRPHGSLSQSGAGIGVPMPGMTQSDTWRPSPPSHSGFGTRHSPSPHYGSNLPSPPASSPGPTPPAHGAPSRSNTLDRHPQERPLPPQPARSPGSDYFQGSGISRTNTGVSSLSRDDEVDQLFDEVEGLVRNAGRSPSISISQAPFQAPRHAAAYSSQRGSQASRNGTANGHLSPVVRHHPGAEAAYSSDSDAEATQGLAMMQMADEEDRRQSSGSQMRFGTSGSLRMSRPQPPPPPEGSDSDGPAFAGADLSSFAGYDVPMSYGGGPAQLAAGGEVNGDAYSQPVSSQHSSMRRSHASQSSQMSRASYDYRSDQIHPFPAFNPAARVEVGGTGGLEEPSATGRRQSYDEGDEYSFMESQLPDRFPDEPPDISFHQAGTSYPSRPLPAVPYPDDVLAPLQSESKSLPHLPGQPTYPGGPDAYVKDEKGQFVPRSSSLVSHSTTPLVTQPLRSKTDAEERRLRQQQARSSMYTTPEVTPANVGTDLPALGARRFMPSKLGAPDFKKCEQPWALSHLLKWLLQVTNSEVYTELKEAEVKEALVALFTHKVPTMNIADAEVLSNRVVDDMFVAGTLVITEEWVKIVPGPFSGVIFQLTQHGCYAPTVHDHLIQSSRCYAPRCQRTLRKINLAAAPTRTLQGWAEYYELKKEDVEGKDKKEVERQNVLHEIVQTEERYMVNLDVLRTLYRDSLARADPPIIAPKRQEKFIQSVFGMVDAVKQANEEHLLPQLKYRQQEQGPWIVGFSDIFRQWVRKARSAYIDYANEFPKADHMVREEMDRNIEFRNFTMKMIRDERSERLSLDSFLKSPISRLQRYTLLLGTVLRNMKEDSHEKANLQLALDEVKAVTLECDGRVAEMQRKIDLHDLGQRLVLRPGMQKEVELNLEHFGRQLIHRGDLQRMGSNRFTWLDCHALLFDHYLVLAKTVAQRVGEGGKMDRYDVSRLPIPMDLLQLDSVNEPPVQKSTYLKGLSVGRSATPNEPTTLGRTPSNQAAVPGGLVHVNTSMSANSLNPTTSLEGKDSDRILYPFRIKHLGRDTYQLFALTEQARKDWVDKLIIAKTKHAAALHAQNAEPFRLRVMADSAFVFDQFANNGKGVVIKGTPVDRAVKEVEHRFKDTGRPGPICRARVNCAASFSTPYPGKQMVAVGTDYGVYVAELDNPRGWTKAINMSRVTQVAVLEEFNLFLLISDKSLIAYHLDVVCPNERNGPTPANDSSRKAPQKLSGSRDVGFFVTGKMKDRTLVFYKKRENLNSVFKVLEPVYQKSTEKRSRAAGLLKRGNTEFFREYDEFYIPTECNSINLFQSSLAVGTSRGFEVLTLDKKQPWSVPELKTDHVQNIATTIKDMRPICMLRLSEQEFILCYEKCAVYANKHGEVSRSVVMNFVGNAQHAALYGPYLVLFDNDFVEIRNAQNGRLKQIIAGREVKCLDDGTNWSANGTTEQKANGVVNGFTAAAGRTLKLVMQHPEMDRNQIVVELLLNENMKE